MKLPSFALAAALLTSTVLPASAALLRVPQDHPTIQAAIDAAPEGAQITVDAGTYDEDIDFLGKTLVVEGAGPQSVIRGTGTGPVVRIVGGEADGTTLDSFTITGGVALFGGGVLIQGTSPRILRNVIVGNTATGAGSGIFVGGSGAAPLIANNLMLFNVGIDGSDPHTIQVFSASPRILNNTIVRNDSNGILTSGAGASEIRNNLIARNGTRFPNGGAKGRGICDFADGSGIHYNVFFRNVLAALVTGGSVDYRNVRDAQAALGSPRLTGNRDAAPRFLGGHIPRVRRNAAPERFLPNTNPLSPSPLVNAGDPSAEFLNLDGSRNTVGVSGGPFAPAWALGGS